MKTHLSLRFAVLFLLIFVLGICRTGHIALGGTGDLTPIGKTYFTRANIWYENPGKILSTNYHKGVRIPVGSKATIANFDKGVITFTVEGTGTFRLIHVPRHSTISAREFFDRYFSKGNVMAPGGAFHNLTPREQQNVKNGTIAEGMSRDAVLMAYGYPPSRRNPNLNSPTWIYWYHRALTVVVHFSHDKVIKVEKSHPFR
jgi:hypothetical protein